jgi:hypothetical protein
MANVNDLPGTVRQRDLLLTFARGDGVFRAQEFTVFLRSAQAVLPPSVDKVLYTPLETQEQDAQLVERHGIAVCRTSQVRGNYLRDRWKVFHDDLWRSRGHYRYVCISDARDVLFQADPFPLLAARLQVRGCQVLVFAEGMAHRQCAWNTNEQQAFQQSCVPWQAPFADWPVANGGVVMGQFEEVRQLCLLLWIAALRIAGRCSDQAAMNYLLHVPLREVSTFQVERPLDSVLVVTGQGVQKGHVGVFFDGQVRHPETHEPYCLVHQWDRTEYRKDILRRFVQ